MRTSEEKDSYRYKRFQDLKSVCSCKDKSMREATIYLDASCKCRIKLEMSCRQFAACIPQKFKKIWPRDISQKEIFETYVKNYVGDYKSGGKIHKALKQGIGLCFLGDNGTGKTQFLCYMANVILYRTGFSCYYTTMPNLLHNVYATIDNSSLFSKSDYINLLKNVDFLMIDEFGKGPITDFSLQLIEAILRERHENLRPINMAANLSEVAEEGEESLETIYGPTISSIVKGSNIVIYTDPKDFRENIKNKKAKEFLS